MTDNAVWVPPAKPVSRFPGRLAVTVYGFLAMFLAFVAGLNMFTTGTFFGNLNDVNPIVVKLLPVFGVGAVLGLILTVLWAILAGTASRVDRIVGGFIGIAFAAGFGWFYGVYAGWFPGF